jgi:hypothetical protein
LDTKATEQLWKTFLRRLEQGQNFVVRNRTMDYVKYGVMKDKPNWNGREIRNAISTAAALARKEQSLDSQGRIMLTEDHIRLVVESSQQFDNYLTATVTTDFSTSERAKITNIRKDRYEGRASSTDDSNAEESGDDIGLQVQELETQLKITKLKRRQKQLRNQRALKGKKGSRKQADTSDTD